MLQAIPYRAVVKPALVGAVGATFVAGAILAWVVWLFTRFLSCRLQSILDICDAALIHKEYSIGSQDEISQFSNAFLSMVKQQNTLLEQLQLANAELIRSNRLKDSFLANMSHELRTPLNAILGMTEGLLEGISGTLNPPQMKALQTVERSGSHLLALINDILDMAKIEAGQVQLDYSSTAIAPLCQSSLAFVKQQALKKRIQLQVRVLPYLPDLIIDERRIRQVLINLLSNAVKFTPEGGKVSLEVTLESETNSTDSTTYLARFAVIDTGIGIAPDHLDSLFQPFTQIDNGLNRQYQGTGLGLALVKQTVELHGGQVGVSSAINLGSRFWVDLPYLALPIEGLSSLSNRTAELPSQTSLAPNEIKPNTLILLVEDDEANINTISSYLNAKGYRVAVARHGQAAIDWLQFQQPDLIVMDIQMPGIDGMETMQQIRGNPLFKDLPIIALTALAMAGDRERFLAAGANDYCTKPVRLKQLVGIIQDLLTAGELESSSDNRQSDSR
jgi:signal transduction histidine kinase/ActR/RegA family two-component response regulator